MFLLNLLTGLSLADNLNYDWRWEKYASPDIEICPDSNLSVQKVDQIIDYWFDRGVIVNINTVKRVEYCDMKKFGVIQISGYRDFNLKRYHAMTDIKWHYYGVRSENTIYYIDRVHIQLPNEALDNRPVVLHEFGHALGLGHSNDFIMKRRHD